ncbi:MAG TPA: ferritin-like domain-containing protein [bacterium]|nr:ferritin-like domain-containing protein [bacterium]
MLGTNWLRRFLENRRDREEPDWNAPCALPERLRRPLGRSLSHFQLGESGGGEFLLANAESVAAERGDPDYPRALALFVAEENDHARLLARLVERYGATLTREHWTHFAFHHLRHAAGLDFELQVLVIAEMIGNAYYETLGAHLDDPPLAQAIERILRDESLHCQFHLDRLHLALDARAVRARRLWALAFVGLFEAALAVAWLDHRGALRAAGARRGEFLARARRWRRGFLGELGLGRPAVLPTPGDLRKPGTVPRLSQKTG